MVRDDSDPPDGERPSGGGRRTAAIERPASERERLAEAIAGHLDLPMTGAGVIFLLLVAAETITDPDGAVGTVFTWLGWSLWVLFVAEFLLRLVIAPSTAQFLRHNWWQIVFLAVPALRFLRALRALRAARLGRVVSSAVRTGRSAGRRLSSRVLAIATVTAIVVLAASQILFETGSYETYGEALYAAALATIVGEPLFTSGTVERIVELALLCYSVVVFATLAGSMGAFILERRDADRKAARQAAS